MITKEQALTAHEFHWGNCTRTIGKRGAIRESVVRFRRNGQTQTWKRDPSRWRVPVKRGLYEYGDITPDRAHEWHTADDCPLLEVDGAVSQISHMLRVQPVTFPMFNVPWYRAVCTCTWTETERPTHVIAEEDAWRHAREVSPDAPQSLFAH